MFIGVVSPTPVAIPLVSRSTGGAPRRTGRTQGWRVVGKFGRHLGQVVRKDVQFLKNRIGKGVEWANGALRIPQLSKTLDDLIWLRNLEDSNFPSFPRLSWPQPFYPGYKLKRSLSLPLCMYTYYGLPVQTYVFIKLL